MKDGFIIKYKSVFERLKFKDSSDLLRLFMIDKIKINNMIKRNELPVQTYNLFYMLYANYLYYYECPGTMRKYVMDKRKALLKNPIISLMLKNQNLVPRKFMEIKTTLDYFKSETSLVFFENYQTLLQFERYLLKNNWSPEAIVTLAGKSKMTVKTRNVLLKSAKESEVKIILATSVIEEGIDLKGVDLVVFYKPISNKIRVVQRKGRTGRHADGHIVIFGYNNTKEIALLRKID